jgi:hypothetical protein
LEVVGLLKDIFVAIVANESATIANWIIKNTTIIRIRITKNNILLINFNPDNARIILNVKSIVIAIHI